MESIQQLDLLYLKVPGTEPITLITRRGVNNDSITSATVSHAWMRILTRNDAAKGLVTSAHEGIVWNIPNVLLNGAEIETGDTITDQNSVVYTVMSVTRVRLRTHWRCICRREK